jgi:exodeoxyribonuclease-3
MPCEVSYGLGTEEFDHEGRVIRADYGDFVLFNIYFPNGGRGDDYVKFKLRFYDCFLDLVTELQKQGREVICCGDVNTAHKEIDLSNPKANSKVSGFLPEERAYMDKFADRGLIDTFRMLHPDKAEAYSWWSYKTFARDRNVGWRIDYFFVTEGLRSKVIESDMMSDVMGSDHCPIYLDLDI